MSELTSLREIAATSAAISKDPTTDPVNVRRQHRRLAGLVADLADHVAALRERSFANTRVDHGERKRE